MRFTGAVPLFQVFDMPTSVAFYRDQLGFELAESSSEIEAREGRYFHWCRLRHGAVEVMLNTAYDADERPSEREAERWRGHRDVTLNIACDDADATHAELAHRGIAAEPPSTTFYGTRRFSLHDPDGFEICFQSSAR